MTSPREAVSILTAAALVVAPVGGVAATYTTGYADDDLLAKHTAQEKAFPKSYDELVERIEAGELFSLADLDIMADAKMGFLTAEEHGVLHPTFETMQRVLDQQEAAAAAAEAEAAAQKAEEERLAAEKAAQEEAARLEEAERVAAEEAAKQAEAAQNAAMVQTLEATQQTQPETVPDEAGSANQGDSGPTEDQGTDTNGPSTDGAGGTVEGEGNEGEVTPPAVEPEALIMPDWANDETVTLESLIAFLTDNKITYVQEEVESDEPAGTILETLPEAGAEIPAGTEVVIKVAVAKSEEPAPEVPEQPSVPDTPEVPEAPEVPSGPEIDVSNPVDSGIQKPGNAGGVTDESHTAAVIKGQAQTPLKQVAVTVPSISFTHIDNSAYVARHYSEDLTTEKFISLVGESARTIAVENDLYASVMIAQAILESASGNSTLAQAPNNNLFGIKGTYHGNSVQLPTREDDGTGATYTIMSDFRQYETVDESLSDYADLLSNSMGDFYAGARKSNSDSFVDACDFLVGRYATDIFYSEKLQDLIETYDLTRFDVPLTYELADTFVLPVKDEVTGLDKYLDPVTDKVEYEALVAEYRDYVARTSEYQQALAEWNDQMAAAEELYHVPVYLEKPSMPAADTPMQQHQDAIDAERFEGFDTLIATGQPLPVREARTLNDLTACANSFLGVPYLWGGTTPAGFDCSGLVQYCYREVFNIELPRTTYYQCEVGVEVPFEELLPGDLLFFADGGDVHHVAMYLGDGYYVEAPHTGDVVKITAMNDKLPDFAKRVVDVRGIDMSEFSDEQLAQFVEREKYLQEREQRLGVTDETLAELTEWLRGLEF